MDKEKKDKEKKKKILKKETVDNSEKDEKSSETPRQYQPDKRQNSDGALATPGQKFASSAALDLLKDFRAKRPLTSRERGTNTPDGFYVAHPRNIKRIAHFRYVHNRKLAELLEAFHMFDFDRDGEINEDDLRKTFVSLCMNVEDEEIEQMLSEALSPLNFDAFIILMGYRTLDLDPEEVLLDALSNWDDHHSGLISCERLMKHIMVWGDKFTEEEATSALADAPVVLNKAKEKMIDYIQFSEDLCGLRKMMQKRTNEEID